MNADRLDHLLERFLETGELPAEVTAEERADLLALADAAGMVRAAARPARDEARASAPAAKARFERYRSGAVHQGSKPERTGAREHRRGWLTFGSLAAAAVVGLAVIAAIEPFGRRTESAQAIEAGDFVQLEGTVESTATVDAGQLLTLATAVGELEVVLSAETAVTDGSGPVEPSAIRPGQGVLFAGVAGSDRRIAASTLSAPAGFEAHRDRGFDRLDEIRERFAGTVILFALADDGTGAHLLLEREGGERVLVPVEPGNLRELAADRPELVGARVTVDTGTGHGELSVAFEGGGGASPGHFVTFAGTVASVEGARFNLATADDSAVVRVRRHTRIVLPSGEEAGRPFAAIRLIDGRDVTVQGAELRDGSLVAALIVVVPE